MFVAGILLGDARGIVHFSLGIITYLPLCLGLGRSPALIELQDSSVLGSCAMKGCEMLARHWSLSAADLLLPRHGRA